MHRLTATDTPMVRYTRTIFPSYAVLISTFNTSIFIELKKVYVGVEIELSNKGKVYVYISKNPVIQHNLQFEEDYKIAKQIDKKLKRMALEKNRLD